MDPVRIGSRIPAEKMHSIIEKMPFKKRISINYEDYKDRFIYSFSLPKRKINEDITLINIMTKFVQDIIMSFYIKSFIIERIRKLVKTSKGINTNRIAEEVYLLVKEEDSYYQEKENIYNEIFEYLIDNKILIIDGYLKFRPKSFNDLIDKAIEHTLGHIQIDMEYNEFIETLKYYVETQVSEIELVNVIFKNNDFEILDNHGQKVNNDYITVVLQDLFYDQVTKADILLSSLIGLSPRCIVLHRVDDGEKELIGIIKKIFTKRVKICEGCSICSPKISKTRNQDKS